MNGLPVVTLFGFPFLNFHSEEEAAEFLMSNPVLSDKLPIVCTPNAAQVVDFEQHLELKNFFKQSAFILPDGSPIVWLSRLVKKPLTARITGSGIFPYMWQELARAKKKVLMVVSEIEIQNRLQHEFPDCHFLVAPVFTEEFEAIEWTKNLETLVREHTIRYVFVGLGFPKQEWLCRGFLSRMPLNSPLFLLFGASFEFYCGLKKRAPKTWQRIGLEWLYRFTQEPRRLWHRYTIINFKFMLLFIAEWRYQISKK